MGLVELVQKLFKKQEPTMKSILKEYIIVLEQYGAGSREDDVAYCNILKTNPRYRKILQIVRNKYMEEQK